MAFRPETKPNPCRRTSTGWAGQGASRPGCGPCRGRRRRRRRAGAPSLRDQPRTLPRRRQSKPCPFAAETPGLFALEAGRLCEVDFESVAFALVAAGHFGAGVAEVLLHVGFLNLGGRG